MFSKFNKSKFQDYLMAITFVIAIGGLELAAFHVISGKAGIYSFLPFIAAWAATFGDF